VKETVVYVFKGCSNWRMARVTECKTGKIMKVIDRYAVAMKKERIIIGDLPRKYLEFVE